MKTLSKIIFQLFLIITILVIATPSSAQWKPAGDKIKTKWAEKLDRKNVLKEYPRPLLQRTEWKNLNGLWDYAISDTNNNSPIQFEKRNTTLHLSPSLYTAIESLLSYIFASL